MSMQTGSVRNIRISHQKGLEQKILAALSIALLKVFQDRGIGISKR
jgi:hypothetical protein